MKREQEPADCSNDPSESDVVGPVIAKDWETVSKDSIDWFDVPGGPGNG